MFFVKTLRRDVLLPPAALGRNLKQNVRERVFQELEGRCLGKHGYVICVLEIKDEDIRPGLVDNDSGSVEVVVWYSAVLFRSSDYVWLPPLGLLPSSCSRRHTAISTAVSVAKITHITTILRA
jgi:hypothetical protein